MVSLHSKGFLLLLLLNAFLPLVVPNNSWRVSFSDDSKTAKLTVQCKTNYGAQTVRRTLNPGGYTYTDYGLLLVGRTLVTCDLTLGNLRGTFPVFDTDRNDKMRCPIKNECLWDVNEAGVFLSAQANVALHFNWPK